jgi:hypothetical protein
MNLPTNPMPLRESTFGGHAATSKRRISHNSAPLSLSASRDGVGMRGAPTSRFLARTMRMTAVLAVFLTASAVHATTVAEIVGQVSLSSYTGFLNDSLYTHNGDNRGIGATQHDQARTNIFNFLQGDGFTTSLDPFIYSGNTYNNVVGVKPGLVHPEQIYLVGAHYDSAENPGADDNASGVAGVLEAARVLSQYSFEATIVFVAFDREEQGLIGSSHYAAEHAADLIMGMVSMDMIAYSAGDPTKAWVYYSEDNNSPLTANLSSALLTYGDGIVATVGQMGYSDHVPFDTYGKNAALLIEYNVWSNPLYHQGADSVDTANYIDYGYATSMTRGVVGLLAEQAGVMSLPIPEPTAALMTCAGLLVICLRRRQRS